MTNISTSGNQNNIVLISTQTPSSYASKYNTNIYPIAKYMKIPISVHIIASISYFLNLIFNQSLNLPPLHLIKFKMAKNKIKI
jgi:hypothetical protein